MQALLPSELFPHMTPPHIWTRGPRGCLLAAVGELLEHALLLS